MVIHQLPSAIVGREHEVARLRSHLDQAVRGQGGLVLISGEAGIGKSTLLSCLRSEAHHRDIPVLTGAADALPSAPPYSPWLDLFSGKGSEKHMPDLPEWLGSGASLDRFQTQGALYHEIAQFLARAGERTALLLILEDLHRADAASMELLRYLNRRLDTLPVTLACSYRTDEIPDDAPLYHHLPELVREAPVERIQLGRLDDSAVRELIAQQYRLTAEDEERLVRYIQAHAEGNPLFITELFRVLEEEQLVLRTAEGWTLGQLDRVPVPPLVRQIVDGRLRHLGDEIRWLINIAAMLGRNVPFDIWQQVAGVDESRMERAVGAAMQQNILLQSGDGSLTFSHPLIREVLLAAIILPRRRSLHRQIADTLIANMEADSDPDLVAHHLWAARDPRAVEWLVQAAERAADVYAWEVVEERLTRALTLARDTSDDLRIRALRLRGTARATMGRFDASLADRQEALSRAKQAGDQQSIWQALIDLGELWTARDYQEVDAYYHQALDLAREMGDSRTLAHSLNRIGNWYANIDQPREGLGYHERALELFRSAGDEAGVAQSLDLQAIAAYLYGDMAASAGYYRDAIRLFREHRDLHGLALSLPTLMLTGGSYDTETVHVAPGSSEEWLRYGYEGLDLADRAGWRAAEAFILTHIGLALGPRGDYQDALEYAQRGLRLASDIDHREWVTAGHYTLGVILVDCLNPRSGYEHLKQAYDASLAAHSLFWTRVSVAGLASAHLAFEELDEASQLLQGVIDRNSGVDSISLRQCWFRRAELELASGNPESALEIVDHLIATTPGGDHDRPPPRLAWLRGRTLVALSRYQDADDALAEARLSAQQHGYRPLLWRIDLAAGDARQLLGDRGGMAEAWRRGRDNAIQLSDQIADGTVRTGFRERVLSMFNLPNEIDGRAADTSGLSQREREVLALVARGMTDGEVGEALFISPRTVGRHLQSIYFKLGVNSRTAAARMAVERRLT